ncbi:SusC/RagA family TonB-linked outer membrane protein [Flavihumibacter petaseus]|uniref:Putative TonB-dependent receptor n=1 Tax=Flavihumibacter petaseus NBRC 106054 TaxID=1220578 RepID=A0A0E9N5F9_9BACT|nr:SusC/RagA family TonB-linked outer membrane protein [Flavihumibacter petaseus]GAO45054.1 putative TonB-dependent receptor [Flavihumibacter petaseus NBRC 106054]
MIAALPRWVRGLSALLLLLLLCSAIQAQDQRVISGKITDQKDGSPIVGATVTVKGSTQGVSTGADGTFKISVPASAKTLVISSIGFGSTEQSISATTSDLAVALTASNSNLNEVVVVGYGTARKKDLTGSVATVKEKDFNQGIMSAPDQLIQGKIAGVQILNNSGQPGGATTVRIRGTATIRAGGGPLYVVDGVPLDGRSARPGLNSPGLGNTPDANPLNFINPQDIASMDVLKDASATAIYGSRGANGVVLITTKRGTSGAPKLDVTTNFGFSQMLKQLDVLDGDQYRAALKDYGLYKKDTNDYGGNVDAMDAITRSGFFQNYTAGISGGNENARLRASIGYYDQDGIVQKTDMKKYTASLNGNFKFLENKRLGLDINILTSQTVEHVAPISNDAGFEGSLIGMALQWNPTRPLRNPDGSLNIRKAPFPETNYNPLAMSEAYEDRARTTNILASLSPYFKITNDLEYRFLVSINYGLGNRKAQMANWMNLQGNLDRGWAGILDNEMTTKQLTHTLNYNKQLNKSLYLGATLGYEYMKFDYNGHYQTARDFPSNSLPYWDYMGGSSVASRDMGSFIDPTAELQSFFGRVNLNFKDRFLLTGTMRADGSNKFGKNNRYGYFPSAAFAWNITNEDFMKSSSVVNNLKLRVGYGVTGNQDFPSGASQARYVYTGPGTVRQIQLANPNLKWETSTTLNFGVDYSLFKSRLYGSVEYFIKKTDDLLINSKAVDPAPGYLGWSNIPGTVTNSGLEVTINSEIISKDDMTWTVGVFASFLKNEMNDYFGPPIYTGAITGQGLTGATSQKLENGQPINAFYMGKFLGIDKNGNAQFEGGDPNNVANKYFVGDPNPKTLLGFSTTFAYKKFSATANMNGAFGQEVYNNTTQAVLTINNLATNKNVASSVYVPSLHEVTNAPQPVSTRYLEKGDYFKMANLTFSYQLGKISKYVRNSSVYITGQNLFVITKYTGFDPEVNTPKPVDGVPSFGIEYTPYPSARVFMVGLNLSL